MPVMTKRDRDHELFDDLDWPPWAPVLSAVIFFVGVAIGLGLALLQRSHMSNLTLPVIAAAGFVLLPFALDAVDALTPLRVALPLRLFPVPVLLGELYLVSNPAEIDIAPFTLVILCAEMASRSPKRPTLGIVTTLAAIGVMVYADVVGPWDESFIWIIGFTFGWVGGFLIWALGRKTIELKEAQDGLAEKAAGDERSRIAREVHDVIAHSLSVTMLHVTAARMALEKGDRRQDALEALQEAEQQGRKSLTEIRRTVGLLGPGDATAPPMPSAGDLPKLVSEFRSAGIDVSLSMIGDITDLLPTAGLSLYRIVQESLTNVAKHAPGAHTTVDLTVTDADIQLRVHNASSNGASRSADDGGGLGIRGMVERAGVLNGTLAAGPDDEGWTVLLSAPRAVESSA